MESSTFIAWIIGQWESPNLGVYSRMAILVMVSDIDQSVNFRCCFKIRGLTWMTFLEDGSLRRVI